MSLAILGGVPGRISAAQLIGRAAELESLHDALDTARTGSAQLVLLGGEAGVGKSRLIGEFVGALPTAVRVVTGQCLELREAVLPFAPLVGILRQLSEQLGPDRTDELFGRELRPFLPGARAGAERPMPDELFAAVHNLLGALDEPGATTVLVVEDAHWADRASLDLISYLARELGDSPVLIVVTYRTDELRRSHPLRPVLAELGRLATAHRIDLAPLTDAQVAALLGQLGGDELPAQLGTEIVDRAEGNPFFVEELLAAAGDRGLPANLQDILTARLETLPEQAREVVRIAAAAGRRVDHRLLAGVARLDADQLERGLREAVEHGALVPDSLGYRFRHALLQEAAHAQLLPGERTRLHAAFADALVADPSLAAAGPEGAPAELAHHALAAYDLDRAYPALIAAAEHALELTAEYEAARFAEQALEIHPRVSPEIAGPLWQVVSLAARMSPVPEDKVDYGERAVALLEAEDEPAALGAELGELAWSYWIARRLADALDASERGLRVMPAEPTVARAGVLASRSRLLMFAARYAEGVEVGTEAVQVARQTGAEAELSSALNSLGCSKCGLGDEHGLELLREAIDAARRVDRFHDVLRGHNNLGSSLITPFERIVEAEQVQRTGLDYASRRRGFAGHGDFLRLEHVNTLLRLGRWDEAQDELLAVRPNPRGLTQHYYDATRTTLLVLRGRPDEALGALGKLRDGVQPELDAPQGAVLTVAALLRLHLAGRWPDPVEVPEMVRVASGEPAVFDAIGLRARAALAGDDAAARIAALLAEVETGLARPDLPAPVAESLQRWAAFVRAEQSRLSGSDVDLWRAALAAMLQRADAESELYAQYRLAEALVLADRTDEAADELFAGHTRAVRMGAAPMVGEFETLARRSRIRLPGSSGPSAADLLTAREGEVLGLVAEGLTNREIGRRLYISEKTASVHVSNLMAKLGAANRTEAVHLAAERGIS